MADHASTTARRDLANVLDHVAVVSSRPAALFDCYERMGFTLSPETRHAGSVRPGGPTEPLGTGNRCAMFAEGGYLELLAVFDPTLHCRGFPERLERYEGLHILAFECADAVLAAAALRTGGIAVQGIGHLERNVDTPDGLRSARFSLVRIDPGLTPECHFNILQHWTPEVLWQAELVEHGNGARRLLSATVCVEAPAAAAARFEHLLDARIERLGDTYRLSLRRGHIDFVRPERLSAAGYQGTPPGLPFISSFSVLAPDLSRVEALLEANGLPYDKQGDAITVPPQAAMGAAVSFEGRVE